MVMVGCLSGVVSAFVFQYIDNKEKIREASCLFYPELGSVSVEFSKIHDFISMEEVPLQSFSVLPYAPILGKFLPTKDLGSLLKLNNLISEFRVMSIQGGQNESPAKEELRKNYLDKVSEIRELSSRLKTKFLGTCH